MKPLWLLAGKRAWLGPGSGGGGLLNPVVVIDGRVVGTWRREIKKDFVLVETKPFRKWSAEQKQKIAGAADRYGKFLGLPVQVT